jgi:hypothetical protein
MEALTRREAPPVDEPVATQYSVERALRIALAHGDVTPETIERPVPEWPPVRLRHEPAYTRDTIASIQRGVPLSRALLSLTPVDWLSVLVGTWRSYGRTLHLSPHAVAGLFAPNAGWRLDELELVFPARVVVRLRDGRELVAERRLHPGQPGCPDGDVDDVVGRKAGAYTQAA